MTNKGIYLVANLVSENLCKNLVYSIRSSGCQLPIKIIHFGGDKIKSEYLFEEAQLVEPETFPKEGLQFVDLLQTVLTDCPRGFLYRFLAWFGEWEEFIYSDNDIVALLNWNHLFDHLKDKDLVHADEEYLTEGKYNYYQPSAVTKEFGKEALSSALTAGHFAARRKEKLVEDMEKAVSWFKKNAGIPKKHDQALLHIALLIGNWNMQNLCKPPNNWLSSWAGDYKTPLTLIQKIQEGKAGRNISHLHYSGSKPEGNLAIQDLLFSSLSDKERLKKLLYISVKFVSKFAFFRDNTKRVIRRLKQL